MLDLEFGLSFHVVCAASHDGGVQLFEGLDCVTKLGRFVDSTGRVGFGIEIQDQIAPAKIRQPHGLAVVSRHSKTRSLIAFLQHDVFFPCPLNPKIPLIRASKRRSPLAG